MEKPKLQIIRSDRKTMALEVTPSGLLVRAPLFVTEKQIETFVSSHRQWIEKQLAKLEKRQEQLDKTDILTADEIKALGEQALSYIPPRVAHYAPIVGVTYGNITIRNQRSRWGSCSSKGNLNFNCLLMLTPPEVIDSVVVHELCHRKEMNHSDRFYAEVLKAFPEYHKWNKWLKENGPAIMMRMTGK